MAERGELFSSVSQVKQSLHPCGGGGHQALGTRCHVLPDSARLDDVCCGVLILSSISVVKRNGKKKLHPHFVT